MTRRAFVYRVQEDDAVLVFDGGKVDVGKLFEFFGQPGEFEIMRGEQGVAAVDLQQVARDGVQDIQGQTTVFLRRAPLNFNLSHFLEDV